VEVVEENEGERLKHDEQGQALASLAGGSGAQWRANQLWRCGEAMMK
jgi:hypothetical protein